MLWVLLNGSLEGLEQSWPWGWLSLAQARAEMACAAWQEFAICLLVSP